MIRRECRRTGQRLPSEFAYTFTFVYRRNQLLRHFKIFVLLLLSTVVTIIVHTNDFTWIKFDITHTPLQPDRVNVKMNFISTGVSKIFECLDVSRFAIQLLCGEFLFVHIVYRSHIQPKQSWIFLCVLHPLIHTNWIVIKFIIVLFR